MCCKSSAAMSCSTPHSSGATESMIGVNAMRSAIKILALIAWLPLFARAEPPLQCGDSSITTGTTQDEVAARCGQPAHVDHQVMYGESGAAAPGGLLPGRPVGGPPVPGLPPGVLPGIAGRSSTEISVEIWTYNFGPNRLMQRIRFENGVVVKIESLGYGS